MKQLVEMERFYRALKGLAFTIDDLDRQRNKLREEIERFNKFIQQRKVDDNLFIQNKEMATLLEDTINRIKTSSDSWILNFEEMIEKEKFRSDLANYFIIIIFGKVKAGKSSLGNFVANHRLLDQKVEFFKYDVAGKEQTIKKLEEVDEKSFDTDNLECTVEIQGFKLDGLAWIDTPGLKSMNKENGDLAKEYIKAADYVIFPTSSDSPMQKDEIEQLEELFAQNKKVTICITKSDTTEEDECECGSEEGCEYCDGGLIQVLQNKPRENREKQEQYVKSKVDTILDKDKESVLGDIFSISTHAASKGIEEKNDELLDESNMPKFYHLITQVINEKATELKKGVPYDGLKALIENNIIGNQSNQSNTLRGIRKALEDLDNSIYENIKKFSVVQKNIDSDIWNEIEEVIDEYYSKLNTIDSKKVFEEINEEINERATEIIRSSIQNMFEDIDTSIRSLTIAFSGDDFEIKDKFKTIEFDTRERNKKIGSGLFGTLAAIGAGIALASNPIGWAVAGTVAASAAGSYAGGKIGEALGEKQEEMIRVGDNKEEVIQNFKENRIKYFELYVRDVYKQIQDQFFEPLQKISKEIVLETEMFEKNVNKIL